MKKLKIVGISIFVILLFIPLIFVNTEKDVVSEREKRKLSNFPTFIKNNKINENFTSEFDTWFEEHVGLRETMYGLTSIIKFDVFETSPVETVHVGSDGWLYTTLNDNLKLIDGTFPMNDNDYIQAAHCLGTYQKMLNENGCELLVVLLPSKATIYPENTKLNYVTNVTPIDKLENSIKQNTNVAVLNLKDELLKHKQNGEKVYYKSDTHWNMAGIEIAYKHVTNYLLSKNMIKQGAYNDTFKESKYVGDLIQQIVSLKDNEEDDLKIERELDSNPQELSMEEIVTKYPSVSEQDHKNIFCSINKNDSNFNILLSGDSFASGLAQALERHGKNFMYISNYYQNENLIKEFSPNIYILGITERMIPNLENLIMYKYKGNNEIEVSVVRNQNSSNVVVGCFSDTVNKSDIKWYECKYENGVYKTTINLDDHNYSKNVELHAYTLNENKENKFLCYIIIHL